MTKTRVFVPPIVQDEKRCRIPFLADAQISGEHGEGAFTPFKTCFHGVLEPCHDPLEGIRV